MARNFLKFALRALLKHKGFTALNIVGLAIGIASCLLIVLFVQDEFSYDRFHPSSKHIIRVTWDFFDRQKGITYQNASAPNILTSWLRENFPAVRQTTRLFQPFPASVAVAHGDRVFEETRFLYADSTFFRVFDGYEAEYGDLHTALTERQAIVLSAAAAQKYFGSGNPIGKYVRINNRIERRVTAVLREPKGKSHLTFDFLASDLDIKQAYDLRWDSPDYFSYAFLSAGTNLEEFRLAINKELGGGNVSLGVQRFEDIHLHSQRIGEMTPNSDIRFVYVFSFIAVLILVIACINYVNLATARAPGRAREVGMLKVVGADRRHLFWKFLLEAILGVLPALVLAQILVELSLPWFNGLTDKQVSMGDLPPMMLGGLLVGLLVVVSALAGVYPAAILSRYQPVEVLKGTFTASRSGIILRKGLVALQFSVSMFLMICAVIIYSQLTFLQEKNLGYEKEHLLTVKLDRESFQSKIDLLRTEFKASPHVVDVAASRVSPLSVPSAGTGIQLLSPVNENRFVSVLGANQHFVPTMNLPFLAGTNFTLEKSESGEHQFLVNETFVRSLNLTPDQVIGMRLRVYFLQQGTGTVVGVVGDFHTRSLHDVIEPLLLYQSSAGYASLLLRLSPGNPREALTELEGIWKKIAPEHPFAFRFLDQEYDALYRQERRAGLLVQVFTGLAILVACFGLYGLSSYTTIQRTKEIGIRKVLGASMESIVSLFSKEVLSLLALSFVVGVPVAWWVGQQWLQDFAYRVDLAWWMFGLAAGITALLALVTNAVQATKAALANPVKALRYE